MKFVIVITIVSFVAYVQCLNLEQRDLLLKRKEFCMEITKVDPSLVRKLSRTNFRDKDSPLGRFVHCLLVQSDLMSNEGILKFDVFLNKIPGEGKGLDIRI
ncbi:unnamed protein product [Plutella xylostella]|uniref:(diamondback moth) hypothetical protein n=1 Tax=Plutella xylostella TaxID=51655 RepID=A0A8S4G6H4_PLUXY|nr:unnamed protein product [Plutella xylostella]